jgi:hypothetical protein
MLKTKIIFTLVEEPEGLPPEYNITSWQCYEGIIPSPGDLVCVCVKSLLKNKHVPLAKTYMVHSRTFFQSGTVELALV